MLQMQIYKMHQMAGWNRTRHAELPEFYESHLLKLNYSSDVIASISNVYGLSFINFNQTVNDNLVIGFQNFPLPAKEVFKNCLDDLEDLKRLFDLEFHAPVPFAFIQLVRKGVSDFVFFDKHGTFYSHGDRTLILGNTYWDIFKYAINTQLTDTFREHDDRLEYYTKGKCLCSYQKL